MAMVLLLVRIINSWCAAAFGCHAEVAEDAAGSSAVQSGHMSVIATSQSGNSDGPTPYPKQGVRAPSRLALILIPEITGGFGGNSQLTLLRQVPLAYTLVETPENNCRIFQPDTHHDSGI